MVRVFWGWETDVPRILVVDDNAMMRTVMRSTLERAGHQVILADNGEKALKAAAEGGPFDLVVTDVQMPRMGGVDFVRALRKSRPDLKVLMISGAVDEGQMHGYATDKSLGISATLEKPFTADKLASKVAEILG